MKKLFKDLIKEGVQKKKVVLIYTDKNDTDKFSAGYIDSFSDESLLLKSIGANGEDDGFILFRNEDIYSIEVDSSYIRRLIVIAGVQVNKKSWVNPINLKGRKSESLTSFILKACLKSKILVTLKLIYDNGFTGFIQKIDNESLLIENVNNDGQPDGLSCIGLEDIERIYFEGADQKIVMSLLREKKN